MALTRVTRLSRTVLASVVVTGAVLAAPLAAQAVPHPKAPAPKTAAQATAKLHELAKSSEKLAEQLNQAQIDVRAAQRQAAQASRNAAVAQVKLHTAQHQSTVALTAREAIQSSNVAAARAKSAADAAVAKRALIAKRQADLSREVTKYKALLATLTAAERAKYYNPVPQPAPAKVAQVVARALATAPVQAPTRVAVSNQVSVPAATNFVSGGAAAAISAARAQLGKPYAWGAGGPNSFDCSGLTAWAWRAAGVSLPHNAAAQQGAGRSVSRGDLQPGDLVFFGSPAYHVGLYIGGGLMIHAPTTGDVVKITAISYLSDYSGATRVG